MKIYNKKGLFWGIIWTLLAAWNIVHAFIAPHSNSIIQVKNIIFSIILLAIGMLGFVRAFSKKATREDLIEEQDERNRLVSLKTKSKTLDIMFGFLFTLMGLAW